MLPALIMLSMLTFLMKGRIIFNAFPSRNVLAVFLLLSIVELIHDVKTIIDDAIIIQLLSGTFEYLFSTFDIFRVFW